MEDAGETSGVERLYKYRALEPFRYIADIICENRFHTAPFSKLNDPMEGLFNIKGHVKEEDLRRIKEAKEGRRICSFSRTSTHPVLWAHYASNFRGVCIEVEVTRPAPFLMAPVEYTSARSAIRPEQIGVTCLFPYPLLVRKAEEWALEEEVRAFAPSKFICCGGSMRITRVLLGLETPDVMQKVIRRMTPPSVSVWTTRIGESYEIEIDREILPGDNATTQTLSG
jgi:hypothetical protein